MQASKIVPGKVYAVNYDGKLLRFQVAEVTTVTRRKNEKASPHDHESTVDGWYVDHPGRVQLSPEGHVQRTRAKLAPDAILGVFTEYEELVRRKTEDDAAYKREQEGKRLDAIRLARGLYQLAGILPAPEKMDDYRNPIRASHQEVTIGRAGVVALLAAIMELEKETAS